MPLPSSGQPKSSDTGLLQGFGGRHSAESIVIPLLVILEHPRPGEFEDFIQVSEQPSLEDFLPIRSVEAFDIGILIGLARLDVID